MREKQSARSATLPLLCVLGLAGCGGGNGDAGVDGSRLVMKAVNVLPPGQSGFVSLAGQVQGLAGGGYGPNIDDQRPLYWGLRYKEGGFQKNGAPEVPKAGVEIFRDAFGVPAIYADGVFDLWYGAGYAIAHDRLFLMDAVRRMGAGTMAELTGCGSVPADIQARTLTYTDAEYESFYDAVSQDSKDSIDGYVAGANAWIAKVLADPSLLPAEYVLLSTIPQPITRKDVLASGVLITRTVAAEGGNEFQNIRMLKLLEQRFGKAEGRKIFEDLDWLEDRKAVTTVPLEEGEFSNQPMPADGREAVFERLADWATALPETIWKGPGTGKSPVPLPCELDLTAPLPGLSLPGLGAGPTMRPAGTAAVREQLRRRAAAALEDLRRSLHGGSYAVAIGPSRTRDHGTLLVSGPQLGYSYPTLLVELEIHSGDTHARGVSVPNLPVVGIGYTPDVAWGLTTGYSKTIDSFVETLCSPADQAARRCGPEQYLHNGRWRDMECRDETIRYRAATQGIPLGLSLFTVSHEVCRTVHGPIVAMDGSAGLARSVAYGMWMHELDNIDPVREWSRAKSFADIKAAAARLSWNENLTVATRDGHIAFFHPGRYLRRRAATDQRLPTPGDGSLDPPGFLTFAEMPKGIDPERGYVANWNNKPAYGWLDGEGIGPTSRPGGARQRVATLQDIVATRDDWTFADLAAVIDPHGGTTDHRARAYLPLIASFAGAERASLSPVENAALDLLAGWDQKHYGPGIDITDSAARDGPAATVFGAFVDAIRDELFADLKDLVIDPADGMTVFSRTAGVGSHVFDQSVMDNVALRILDPGTSSLAIRHDFTAGRSRDAVLTAALRVALGRLRQQFGGGDPLQPADLDGFRRVHPRSQICSLTGVIGPGSSTVPGTSCVTMPYQDRGSWVHLVGFESP